MHSVMKPYEGSEPFLFFSYCHQDAALAHPVLQRLMQEGYRIWYDDGLHPGDDWPEVIADHLSRSTGVLAAIGAGAVDSHNCRNEITLALELHKPLAAVILTEMTLSLGMQLLLSASHYVKQYEYTQQEQFYAKLCQMPCMAQCCGEKPQLLQEREKPAARPQPDFNGRLDTGVNEQRMQTPLDTGVNEQRMQKPLDTGVNEQRVQKPLDTGMNEQRMQKPLDTTADEQRTQLAPEEENMRTVLLAAEHDDAVVVRLRTGEFYPIRGALTLMGRLMQNDLVFAENQAVSGCHAKLMQLNGCFYLADNGSVNGTWVGARRLAQHESCVLGKVEEFRLADESFLFLEGEAARTVLACGSLSSLIAAHDARPHYLTEQTMMLGRSCAWPEEAKQDKRISHFHCVLQQSAGGYVLSDSHSTNGTYLNGRRLTEGESAALRNADQIVIGQTALSYRQMRLKEGHTR